MKAGIAPRPRQAMAALLILLGLVGCGPSGGSETTEEEFELTVPMIDLAAVREFLAFGYDTGGGRRNPNWEFRAAPKGLAVRACAPGVVEAVDYDSFMRDWEIRIRHEGRPEYLVIYDHVNGPAVAAGARVAAGNALGTIGNWQGGGGRIELQVNVSREGAGDVAVCPRAVGSGEFVAAHEAAFARAGKGGATCLFVELVP